MLSTLLWHLAVAYWPVVLLSVFFGYLLHNKFGNGINKYPGPFAASVSNWWRFFDVWSGRPHHTHIRLHREHGDIVRVGPRMLSFADPKAIRDIYGLNKGFTKTEFYPVQNNISKGERLQSLFSTTDEGYHAQLRRCVSSAFAMSTLVSYEPLVNSTTSVFLEHTQRRFCDSPMTCDFARWLQFYAFDVIGDVSFSKRLGFIENFEDVDGIIAAIADALAYSGKVGQQPWLDRYFLRKNPIKLWLMKQGLIPSSNPIAAFSTARSSERRAMLAASGKSTLPSDEEEHVDPIKGVDFLTRFLASQKAHPEFMTDGRVLASVSSLINAGSDTTAISLSSCFYYLLRHPRVYRKLMNELDDAVSSGKVTLRDGEIFSFSDAQKLPYLDAVIQESFRVFPAAGLILERHVPAGGATICGEQIPGGTIVGCNAWVLHRRREVFGQDVDAYRPERWLEADPARQKEMRATMFQFGAGARTCIGKNISTLEIYKLVPSFLRKFEIEFTDPSKDWKTQNCWFIRQLDFNVRFKPRKVAATE